jgi:HAD superfamily hydrolase (TIGR01549 family)
MNGNKTSTILFDLDGTLRESVPLGDRFMLEFAISLGAVCNENCMREIRQWGHRYWASSECLTLDEETYGKGEPAFWENYARRTLEKIGAAPGKVREWAPLLHQHMFENYQPEDIIPEDVIPTLKELKKAGFTLGLLTNRTDPVDEYLEKIGLANYLDIYLAAGEVGVWKPDPCIFYYIMGMAGALPEETIYIGDNYYADILGARNAGIEGILIDRERIFPKADCQTIYDIRELLPILETKEKQ